MKWGRGRTWVALVVWTAVTVAALSLPIGEPPRLVKRGLDKVVHTAMFTVMGVLAQAAAPWVALIGTVPVAAGIELLQKKLPHRTYDTVELLANIVGVLLGMVCYEVSIRLRRG